MMLSIVGFMTLVLEMHKLTFINEKSVAEQWTLPLLLLPLVTANSFYLFWGVADLVWKGMKKIGWVFTFIWILTGASWFTAMYLIENTR